MKFTSKKDPFFSILILGTVALLFGLPVLGIIFGWFDQSDFWIAIPFSVIIFLLLWIYFGTSYELTETELIYRSGPLRGRIEISQIHEIRKGKTLYAGLKPATSGKGLIIKYRKFDEIYISPNTNESFIEKIVTRNKNIVISE
ncbi:PH domain-containing protein [Fluviicola sp.]|uniref:PH domain-containing protein n=1 Tax=Fluviicola sp. TaxID=1917219 RepID=UPI00261D3863|nr:PH domain-containing protein [Fluviicola sp.]